MKKVTDLKENECIHCATKEEFKAILELNPKNTVKTYQWEVEKENTVYYPIRLDGGAYGNYNKAKLKDMIIHPASDFLQPTYQLTKSQIIEIAENGSLVKELFPDVFETTPTDVIKVIETYGTDKLITFIEAYDHNTDTYRAFSK